MADKIATPDVDISYLRAAVQNLLMYCPEMMNCGCRTLMRSGATTDDRCVGTILFATIFLFLEIP